MVSFSGHDRIRENSPPRLNDRIAIGMQNRVRELSRMGTHRIAERIEKLEREWDLDRAALVALGAVGAVVSGLGLIHALKGWSPAISPTLRRLGFRSSDEIQAERYALKSLRGDFDTRAI